MTFYDYDSCLICDAPLSCFWTRFSSVKKLHQELERTHKNLELPELPGSSWFGTRTAQAAETRMKRLNEYFSNLLDLEELQDCDTIFDFCGPRCFIDLCVVGCPRIGKMRLLESFYQVTPGHRLSHVPVYSQNSIRNSFNYPERTALPIDMIVDSTLVRIRSIEVRSIDMNNLEELMAVLEDKDGIIFVHSEKQPESLEPVRMLRHMVTSESVIVVLDHEEEDFNSAYTIRVYQDVYTVFEHLVRSFLRRVGIL